VIERPRLLRELQTALRRSPVVALVGPRQCGKTTLARTLVPPGSPRYFDLEDPASLASLAEPITTLRELRGLVVVDEVQRRPDLFPVLRVLADRRPLRARFLILGSASPELLRQSSETLAGRIEVLTIGGFDLSEVGEDSLTRHWRRGGFPQSFLARSEGDSFQWRKQFIQTFLERDLPQLGVRIPPQALHRFWAMLAHFHGNVWNGAELARSLALSQPTVRQYLDLMTGLFMVRQLLPWHENLGKRQVKAPKVYVRDAGLLHQLLGIASDRDLQRHPKLGASFEGYAIEEVLRAVSPAQAYFWATHSGAELDLLLVKGGRRFGVEVKHADAPRITPSMRTAIDDLGLERVTVIYPGERAYALSDRVHVLPVGALADGGATQITKSARARQAKRRP